MNEFYVKGYYSACLNPDYCGYAVVLNNSVITKGLIEHQGHRNILGEIKAKMEAIYYAFQHDMNDITIYYDYNGIIKMNDELTQLYKNYLEKMSAIINIKFVQNDPKKEVIGHALAYFTAQSILKLNNKND